MTDNQCTIKNVISVEGTGLHTGQQGKITFNPAPVNHGIKFRRTDIEGQPIIEADVDHVVDTSRGTTLGKNGARVYTIEHVLAAATGLGVDNLLIDMDMDEIPIRDGSARYFVEALESAGIEEQNAAREYIVIKHPVHFKNEEKGFELSIEPCDIFKVDVKIDYGTEVLNTQHASLDDLTKFKNEIAPCRTFVFLHELEFLLKNNLIRGGDLSNAIVFVNRKVSQEELDRLADLFKKPKVKVKDEGILNNLDLHFDNEPARHKLLDVIGDLSLLGKRIKGHVKAFRPGHYANTEFAKLIKEQTKKPIMLKEPPFDLNQPPVYDIIQIQKILPHRPPFLLIDKIIELSDKHILGVKNVTMNEHYFVGHFPEEPVMPGVLQIEAMAQTGGIFVLHSVPDPENYITYFLKIEEAKFRHKVVPGDTIVFALELTSPIRRGICNMRGIAYVGDKIVTEGKLMAQIAKKH
ncbi:MAG: bifunctional UDP-3-O-[3-hydroxymyristoyl] N-acetylglucosamine deacetylase/3-hydroxyacyl-ACP dehydratase [Bacteroidales bacterium]|jgi:UDP-3-O-[3-hydroxymyristoyl] N-acetylglucosamine deacetylase/3-hydroxyacyl-[acyl-carrier-protein] dehydratase|nr:bifunctional UDP-3-O-[3-hydroxymyristoyl] N-acetylglucosamine deacetylase/3-hydroxyacyl-ACP dehydratase [Bacteroidales bacterium]MDD4086160.1 bifunctional UDP-3-O-[3-hydroxymyristoyl] N-acetylglucosamine deacetylase/3-hydroxyacyl-ACP dehydratase [Bacteroidales bacterium]MDY0085190.1 bifunctional UDP-3-O-[3-hydroxymyristoyl] N-acetylglucosamine deacetylase/3-hydroxyacyl-ACP dehydratase [Bacteroidales bacterium]